VNGLRPPTVTEDRFVYRCVSTGGSSDLYGNCEVCGVRCSDVFIQREQKTYDHGRLTYHGCRAPAFGHEDCLMGIRRPVPTEGQP
jgi:Pyruvate/2-oxoacid:ferredoxin oxidoreductase delta subunit